MTQEYLFRKYLQSIQMLDMAASKAVDLVKKLIRQESEWGADPEPEFNEFRLNLKEVYERWKQLAIENRPEGDELILAKIYAYNLKRLISVVAPRLNQSMLIWLEIYKRSLVQLRQRNVNSWKQVFYE
jgi:hypothetical protein